MVLAAFSLTAVMGMSGLAVELGTGYSAKVRNQRVADMAAIGAALAYKSSSSSTAAATQVAKDIVVANGLPSSAATVSLPVTIGSNSAVQVQITTSVPIRLASMLTSAASYNVTDTAAATLVTASQGGCITALGSGMTTVSATGGASITATGCAVVTNGVVYSDNGSAKVTASQITASSIVDTAASYNQNAVTTNPTANNFTIKNNGASDSVASNSAVQQALCYVNKINGTSDSDYSGGNTSCTSPLVTPTAPSGNTSSTDITFTSGTATPGYAAYYSGGTYTLPAGTYAFRNVTINGGVTVNFGNSNVSANSINMSGNGMTIGNGNVIVWGTFGFNSGSTITIGNGTHYFGSLAVTGGRTLVVGSGSFTVQGSLTEAGGSYVKVGISATDTVTIGGNGMNMGTGIDVEGGSYLCFTAACAAPTAAAGTFSVTGNITTGGGSTIILPNAGMHVISGSLSLNGSSTLGAGLYVIGGNFTNNTGGTMTGANVTFALGGTFNLSGGTSLDLAAPTAASGYGITDILVATKSSMPTVIGGGSSDKYSGVFYAPKSAMSISGGSSISTNGNSCLMVVVNSIASSGSGALNASACSSQASTGGGTVALIQ